MSSPDDKPFVEWWPPYERVREAWRLGRLDESAALLAEGLREYPDAPAMKLAFAAQILEEGEDPSKIPRIKELVGDAVERAPESAYVLLDAAITMLRIGDMPACGRYAGQAGRRAHQLVEPESQAALAYTIGRVAAWGGKHQQAEEAMRFALSLNPDEPAYPADLARVLIDAGDRRAAIHVVADALQRHPRDRDLVSLSWKLSGRSVERQQETARERRYRVRRGPLDE